MGNIAYVHFNNSFAHSCSMLVPLWNVILSSARQPLSVISIL